jgi:hypothetical protein
MARLISDTVRLRDNARTGQSAAQTSPLANGGLPDDLAILPPQDARGGARFVAMRVAMPRRPPEIMLDLPPASGVTAQPGTPTPAAARHSDPQAQPAIAALLGAVASLHASELSWQVTDLAARLSLRADLADNPLAMRGLAVLSHQARLLQHLLILQSAASEGIA